MQDEVGGYDYTVVLKAYLRGSEKGDDDLKTGALRWIRGEFTTKTEARSIVPVRNIIDDANVYDSLKLLGSFVKIAGYGGLMAVFDEMVNLYKLQHPQTRNANYEQILRIINDTLQGNVRSVGFLFGGTPEFLLDTRRGLYSYPALESRLARTPSLKRAGRHERPGHPVAEPVPRGPAHPAFEHPPRHGRGDASKYLVPDEAFQTFMEHCSQRIGEAYFRTPRNTTKSFVHLLSILDQNPGTIGVSYSGPSRSRRTPAVTIANLPQGDGDGLFKLRL